MQFVMYRVFQKSTPLKLFEIFSHWLSRFAWNFANLLTVHIHIYLPIFVHLFQYFIKWSTFFHKCASFSPWGLLDWLSLLLILDSRIGEVWCETGVLTRFLSVKTKHPLHYLLPPVKVSVLQPTHPYQIPLAETSHYGRGFVPYCIANKF